MSQKMIAKTLASKIDEQMRERNFRSLTLAYKLYERGIEVSQSKVTRWRKGTASPNLVEAIAIADAFEMSLSDFLGSEILGVKNGNQKSDSESDANPVPQKSAPAKKATKPAPEIVVPSPAATEDAPDFIHRTNFRLQDAMVVHGLDYVAAAQSITEKTGYSAVGSLLQAWVDGKAQPSEEEANAVEKWYKSLPQPQSEGSQN